jgi:hypothetical protein
MYVFLAPLLKFCHNPTFLSKMSKFRLNTHKILKFLHLLRNENSPLFITFFTTWRYFAFKPDGRAGALWKLSELLNYVFAINLLSLIPSTISLLQFFLAVSLHWTKWRRPTSRSWGIDMKHVVTGWAIKPLKLSKPWIPCVFIEFYYLFLFPDFKGVNSLC